MAVASLLALVVGSTAAAAVVVMVALSTCGGMHSTPTAPHSPTHSPARPACTPACLPGPTSPGPTGTDVIQTTSMQAQTHSQLPQLNPTHTCTQRHTHTYTHTHTPYPQLPPSAHLTDGGRSPATVETHKVPGNLSPRKDGPFSNLRVIMCCFPPPNTLLCDCCDGGTHAFHGVAESCLI